MTDTLQTILAETRAEVARRKAARPYSAVATGASQAGPPRGFTRALAAHAALGKPALIAEIKKASPSKGLIRDDFDPPAHARAYAAGGAACLSVLTNTPAFQGADSHLVAARRTCNLPALRKDFLVDPWQVAESRALGADAVLVILAAVDDDLARALIAESARWGLDVLVEVHDGAEMARARALGVRLVGVNARDLRSFAVDLSAVEALAREIPQGAVLVAESGISTPDDVARVARAGAAAILVGESLMRKPDLESAAKALFGR